MTIASCEGRPIGQFLNRNPLQLNTLQRVLVWGKIFFMEKFLTQNPSYSFLFFVLLWVAISFLISRLSGWGDLASYYSYNGQLVTRKLYLQSGSLRWLTGYRGCLTIGATPEGLYLAVLFLFRMGHEPLFIPWREISIRRKNIIFGLRMLEFRFNHAPTIPLVIPGRLEGFLTQVAGKDLPLVDEHDEK